VTPAREGEEGEVPSPDGLHRASPHAAAAEELRCARTAGCGEGAAPPCQPPRAAAPWPSRLGRRDGARAGGGAGREGARAGAGVGGGRAAPAGAEERERERGGEGGRIKWEKMKLWRGVFVNICQCGNTWHDASDACVAYLEPQTKHLIEFRDPDARFESPRDPSEISGQV